jgi:hypothetical protein
VREIFPFLRPQVVQTVSVKVIAKLEPIKQLGKGEAMQLKDKVSIKRNARSLFIVP